MSGGKKFSFPHYTKLSPLFKNDNITFTKKNVVL